MRYRGNFWLEQAIMCQNRQLFSVNQLYISSYIITIDLYLLCIGGQDIFQVQQSIGQLVYSIYFVIFRFLRNVSAFHISFTNSHRIKAIQALGFFGSLPSVLFQVELIVTILSYFTTFIIVILVCFLAHSLHCCYICDRVLGKDLFPDLKKLFTHLWEERHKELMGNKIENS